MAEASSVRVVECEGDDLSHVIAIGAIGPAEPHDGRAAVVPWGDDGT